MSNNLILYPIFIQVALTFILLYAMGRVRVASVSRGKTKIKDIALGQNAWPVRATQIANTYHNQFQLPVLFYVATILIYVTGQVDLVLIVLGWGFVVMRMVHAWIYVTTNNVRQRFFAFVAGFVLLVVMWIYFAFYLIVAGS